MVVRFKESIRVRLWGRELSDFHKGEVTDVPIAVAGVLLAQGYVEPVAVQAVPQLQRAS
jgi:uncharacterized membrane protein (UPF0182 family)